MSDLISRLSEKLDEAERLALAATAGPWRRHDTHLSLGSHTATVLANRDSTLDLIAWFPTFEVEPWGQERNVWNDAAYIASWDPQSVLRLVAAHREVLALHEPSWSTGEPEYDDHQEQTPSGQWVDVRNAEPNEPYWCLTCSEFTPCKTVTLLAAGWGVTEEAG